MRNLKKSASLFFALSLIFQTLTSNALAATYASGSRGEDNLAPAFVTLNGEDITDQCWSNGLIHIPPISEGELTISVLVDSQTQLLNHSDKTDATWQSEWTCYEDQLTGDELAIYQGLESAFDNEEVSLGTLGWTASNLAKMEDTDNLGSQKFYDEVIYSTALNATCAFLMDHPEYFWVRNYFYVSASINPNVTPVTATVDIIFVSFPYTDTQEEIDALQAKIDAVIETLLKDTAEMTTLGKLSYMDNWLAAHNHYNYTAAMDPNYFFQDETPWSIVSGLLDDHSPVCEGYAKAFQYFCHQIGVPCIQVTGNYHMWTYVQYAGNWYLCDPTWDDPTYADGRDRDYSTQSYFMVRDPELISYHVPELNFILPELAAKDLDLSCADGHNYSSSITEPTCTEQGYTTYTCEACGDYYIDNYVNATGHDMGEWTESKAPTCTTIGEETRQCTQCDHSETREVDAKGHSHESVVTDPTCTEQGYTTHICTCGDSYVDSYTAALGHDMGEWSETKAPTCTEKGSEKRECSRCDHAETQDVPAKGHNHESMVTAPTCTEQGYTTHTCVCGDSYTDTYVDALGHDFTDYEKQEGLLVAKCNRNCGAADEIIDEPSWHKDPQGLNGVEYSVGSVLIALYDRDGRMIALKYCEKVEWKVIEDVTYYRFTTPEFSREDLERADQILCFNFDEQLTPIRSVIPMI